MRVRVDRGADAVTLDLTDAAILESEEVADGIVVDYDAEGRIVGVEILDASRRTGNPEAAHGAARRGVILPKSKLEREQGVTTSISHMMPQDYISSFFALFLCL